MSKEKNFEINLFPIVSLLAVLISFLLLSAVWVHIGTFDVKQAVGQISAASDSKTQKNSTLWVEIDSEGAVALEVKDGGERQILRQLFKPSKNLFKRLQASIQSIKNKQPSIKMAFVAAASKTPYHKVVKALELLKIAQFKNIGITPLR